MNAFKAKHKTTGRIDLLPPDPKAFAAKRGERLSRRMEVVDADFVVIRGSASTSNDNHRRTHRPPALPFYQSRLFKLAAVGARLCEAGLQRLPRRAFAGLVTIAVLFVFSHAGGLTALKAAILPAEPAETLLLTDIAAMVGDHGGMKVLTVYGRLDNAGDAVRAIPPIEVAVEGSERTLHRRVALDAATIAPGGTEHFALRIPHAGGKLPKVSVSLAHEGAPDT